VRKRQKKAEDQQQRADLPTPSSFVVLFSRSQRVLAFMEAGSVLARKLGETSNPEADI
jgi:hypothetical protein